MQVSKMGWLCTHPDSKQLVLTIGGEVVPRRKLGCVVGSVPDDDVVIDISEVTVTETIIVVSEVVIVEFEVHVL